MLDLSLLKVNVAGLAPLDETTWQQFSNCIQAQTVRPGEVILQPNQVCGAIYFINRGLLRTFSVKDGEEINLAFHLESSFATDLRSLRSGQPTEVSIQALEKTDLLILPKADILALYSSSHQLEAMGRRLLESLLEAQEEHSALFKLYSTRERYNYLQTKYPELLRRVSLTHLASYLGVKRETLSRVRRFR